jgi:hypothetical protein
LWAALLLASVLGASVAAQNVQINGAGATFPVSALLEVVR